MMNVLQRLLSHLKCKNRGHEAEIEELHKNQVMSYMDDGWYMAFIFWKSSWKVLSKLLWKWKI